MKGLLNLVFFGVIAISTALVPPTNDDLNKVCQNNTELYSTTKYPHPISKRHYIRCASKKAIVVKCPEHEKFNKNLEKCEISKIGDFVFNHLINFFKPNASETEIDPCWKKMFGTIVPNANDCSTYRVCEGSVTVIKKCPNGMHLNPKKLICQNRILAGCDTKYNFDKLIENLKSNRSDISHVDKLIENIKPKIMKMSCLNQLIGSHIPSMDCNKFWICLNNNQVLEQTCPTGMHFSEEKSFCESIDKSSCNHSIQNIFDKLIKYFYNKDRSCIGKKIGSLLPLDDCNRFKVCLKHDSIEKQCPYGMHFNPKKFKCENEDVAGCKDPESDPGNNYTEPPAFDPLLNYTECNGKKFGDLVAYNNNCNKFIVCMSNKTNNGVSKVCPDGLHFNPKLKVCDYPLEANCQWFNKNNFLGEKNCFGRANGDLVPYPNDCTKFVYCTIGIDGTTGVPVSCPLTLTKGSLHFNPNKKVCDWPSSAGCAWY